MTKKELWIALTSLPSENQLAKRIDGYLNALVVLLVGAGFGMYFIYLLTIKK